MMDDPHLPPTPTLGDLPHALRFPDHLWDASNPLTARSGEMTPLYVERYGGPWQRHDMFPHQYWEFLHTLSGRGILQVEEARIPLAAGTTVLIPRDRSHTEEANGHLAVIWVGVVGSAFPDAAPAHVLITTTPNSEKPWEELWRRATRPFGLIGPELDGLLRMAAGLFARHLGQQSQTVGDGLDRAIAHLNEHFLENDSVADLAARFGYSEGYFYNAFKRRVGMTPGAYRIRQRMRQAFQILRHQSVSVKEAASMTGYDDALYFSRLFRKTFGLAPSAVARSGSSNGVTPPAESRDRNGNGGSAEK